MSSEYRSRQQDIIPEDVLDKAITIIGAGAIGSFTTIALAKMGFRNIQVYDFDEFNAANISSQFCRVKDIGRLKVKALKLMVKDFSDINILACPIEYEGNRRFEGIVISAVDSMSARTMIWSAHKNLMITDLLIDARMGAEVGLLYAMDPNNAKDQEAYETTLYSDENAAQDPCTAKATIYTAMMLSGLIAKTVKNYVCKEQYPRVTQWSIKDDTFVSHKSDPVQAEEAVSVVLPDPVISLDTFNYWDIPATGIVRIGNSSDNNLLERIGGSSLSSDQLQPTSELGVLGLSDDPDDVA